MPRNRAEAVREGAAQKQMAAPGAGSWITPPGPRNTRHEFNAASQQRFSRFGEGPLVFSDRPTGDERAAGILPAEGGVGSCRRVAASTLRFMGSSNGLPTAHWGHEPPRGFTKTEDGLSKPRSRRR